MRERPEILADVNDRCDWIAPQEADVDKFTAADWVNDLIPFMALAGEYFITPERFKDAMVDIAAVAITAIETVERNENTLPSPKFCEKSE